jgi:hypothetical protein
LSLCDEFVASELIVAFGISNCLICFAGDLCSSLFHKMFGVRAMVGDQLDVNVEMGLPLEPPRFDDSATAKAQPVEPISRRRFSNWFGKGGAVRGMITTKSRALALVVVAGLATGTLGGIALVNQSEQSSQTTQTAANESVSGLPNTNFETTETGASGLLVTGAVGNRRKIRGRQPIGGQRAYRVAVIR